ncbi:MAG: hypothetical protein ACYSOQ_05470, partial [Planctomycetota bacterium]
MLLFYLILRAPSHILSAVRIPLTRYGLPQVAVFPLILIAAMILYYWLARRFTACACPMTTLMVWLPEMILLVVLVWVFSFFRDPVRTIAQDT